MHHIAKTLADLFPDVFPQPDNKTRCAHLYDLAVVSHFVESSVNQQSTLAKQRLDVERYFHIGGIHALVLQDDCVEFQRSCHFLKSFGKNRKNACTFAKNKPNEKV